MEKELEATIWCPYCKREKGKVWRVSEREGMWSHLQDPEQLGPRCTECKNILERKHAPL